mmetsp:Transcript_106508/g.306193  ORF Transcript_106508/g.306193 Transcript_106508/m.306193 type:complete len:215 (+) Transcript_106508:263-907(+)
MEHAGSSSFSYSCSVSDPSLLHAATPRTRGATQWFSPQAKRFNMRSKRDCLRCEAAHVSCRAGVHSTTSATITDVSSALPPRPTGVAAATRFLDGMHLSCACATMAAAIPESLDSSAGWNGSKGFGCGSHWLQTPTTSPKNKLSKTPSLPRMSTSPSYAEVQCTELPRSMASRASASEKLGSKSSFIRQSWRGFWLLPAIRCISVRTTTCNGPQ